MPPEIVIEEERLDYVLESFGYEIGEDDIIINAETQEPVPSTSGEPIRKDQLGMLGHGSVKLVKDDISELTSFLRGREE